jgi:hypothetical protein
LGSGGGSMLIVLTATPLVTIAFSLGVRTGDLLMGLPFFIVVVLYTFSGVVTWCLKGTKIDKNEDEEEREHHESVQSLENSIY